MITDNDKFERYQLVSVNYQLKLTKVRKWNKPIFD